MTQQQPIAAPVAVDTPPPPFPFEDAYPGHFGSQLFWCTNEEVELHRELLKGLRLRRVAAIASGGEVALFLLLPKVTKELVLVDHSYQSLAVCYAKTHLLNTLGAPGLKDLFESGDVTRVKEAFHEASKALPTKLQSQLNTSYLHNTNELRKEWHLVSERILTTSQKKLSKLTFIHGDLTDLHARGPFDLLYTSNAFEHTPRRGVNLRKDVASLVRDDGYLLMTGQWYGDSYTAPYTQLAGWILKKEIRGYRSGWRHCLYQKG